MFRQIAAAVIAATLIVSGCAAKKSITESIQPIKLAGRTFCTVFSINKKEGNWGTAGHCAAYAYEQMQMTGQIPTIGDFPAIIAYVDPMYDVAVFQSEYQKPALKLAKESQEVGEFVMIIGYPYGITRTVTKGFMGARNIPIMHPTYEIYMRSDILDITTAGGNSGSPVFNDKDEVIGVLWGGFVNSPHSLAVPLESIKRAFEGFWEK